MKRVLKSSLFEVYNEKSKENEILKLIMLDGLKEEDINVYMFSVNLLSVLEDNNLMKYKCIMKENNYIYILMKRYIKSLKEILSPVDYFKENGIFNVLISICNGIKVIHENGLINGNLNINNILLNEENEVKISDYCKILLYQNNVDKMILNTNDKSKLIFMSPEMIENKELNDRSDIWSIGCILYFLLSDFMIFEGKSILEIMNKIMRCEYKKLECEFSDELNDLLEKMIVVESKNRLSINELIKEIEKTNSIQYIPSVPFLENSIPNLGYSGYNDGIIGIDIGISSSICGVYRCGKVEIIFYNNGSTILPNYVYYNPKNNEVIVGYAALTGIGLESNKIYDSQRFIGLSYNDKIIEEGMKKWQFKIINEDGIPKVELVYNNKTIHLSGTDITSEIVRYIKRNADRFYYHVYLKTTKAVITYPLYFTENQKIERKISCEKANIEVIDLIPEPVSALIYYLYQLMEKKVDLKSEDNYLIFNFTKTRFDITICKVNLEKKIIKIIGYDGDNHLGGDDISDILFNHYKRLYKQKTGKELKPNQILELQKACEDAKCLLNAGGNEEAVVGCGFLEENDIDTTLTREDFNNICKEIFNKTMSIIDDVLKRCELSPKDISYVILSGGSSNIPKIRRLLKDKFPKSKICKNINPTDAVAYGATLYGNIEELHFKIENALY